MSTGKPDVKQDPQRSRDLGHLSFRGAFEQPSELAPSKLRVVLRRQMLLDQRSHVG